jgi:hypothetical protein
MRFVREGVPTVAWYLRLAADFGRPGLYGVVRVEVAEGYLQIATRSNPSQWISDISARLDDARAFRAGYARQHCSLQPIVLLEDRLHARGFGEGDFWNLRRMVGLWE